jgi:N4-gp56 family major capsid protein
MGQTVVKFGDPKAQRKWSGALFLDIQKKSYFDRKFIGTDEDSMIQRLTDLESEAGDTISFDLSVRLRNKPTYGDNRLEGKEESLRFFSDELKIDQMRHGVSAGGKMSRKRTAHNMRQIGKRKLSEYWAQFNDQMIFIYLSGARGINEDFYEETTWAGHATNPLQAPDADHILYGGSATSKATIDANSKMTKNVIEKAQVKATMMSAKNPENANMMPLMINGEEHYVCLMGTFQEHDMRTADAGGWLEIQKALITAEGRAAPIFKGGLGMINNTVLHSHKNSIRFKDYGSGGDVEAGRSLFMGQQAGVIAFGSSGGFRYTWSEETKDHGNEPVVASGVICGVKKTRFNNRDFGVISIDTAAADPNA